jgi:hypothetical protein
MARDSQDKEKGKEGMEKLYAFALDSTEVDCVTEALQAQVSLLQTLPASAWRESRLKILGSLMEKLDQLLEQIQVEQAARVGLD